ncbi:17274_t:CDS:2 [Gigaspora margarita]|uniref:17274_t:CDS:1 n=1 Tax=Gigaspora margarita TaxID=4874 RepID=A0ABN7WB70_GIGMA|nr:17274_t:CDS:2 [Gigaspora margarita]
MSLVNLQNFALNILKEMKHDAVQNIEITELPPCKICNKKLLIVNFDSFTILPCSHVYHRKCIEKNFLLTEENKCPIPDCNKIVDPVISEQRFFESSQSSGTLAIADMLGNNLGLNSPMNILPLLPLFNETTQKKHTRKSSASTEKSSSKKARKTGKKKVSSMLKKLIKELLADIPVPTIGENLKKANESATSIFLQLSDKIDNAETKNEGASRGLIFSYFDFGEAVFKRYKELKPEHGKDGSQALVKSEVRKAIPEAKCSDEALWKKIERSEKVYKLFNSIGKEKIIRNKIHPPGFILNLTKDEKDYIMAEILKQKIMSSELKLLKQHITKLEAENAELRKENIEIPDLRKKISEFYGERAKLMCIMAKTLKMTKEERARHAVNFT